MFRTVVSLMTAAVVLWHAVGGCCAHHGHAVDSVSMPVERVEEKRVDDRRRCCCKHESRVTSSESMVDNHVSILNPTAKDLPPAEQSPFAPCDGERCSFAVSKITTANDLDLVPLGFGYSNVRVVVHVVESRVREFANKADIVPPLLRRYLALSILLI